jgi:uncharacterized membrane protein YraQ (UPF0718 family)
MTEGQNLLERIPRAGFAWSGRLRLLALLAGVALAAAAVWLASGFGVPVTLAQVSVRLQGLVTIFLGIFIEALPFLLAGVLVSSAIHLFVSAETVRRLSPRNPALAALVGALLGLAFPVCECGSVPTTRRLLAKGAPLPLGIAFVLAAPVVNPIVIASTWVAFGGRWEIVLARIGLTIIIAAAIGLVLGLHPRPRELLARRPAAADAHLHDPWHRHADHPDHEHLHDVGGSRLRAVLAHASGEFFEMGRYLVFGALLAAALQVLIPRPALLSLGQGPVVSALALMGLAVILSICSTVDAFVALAFVSSFLPGAVLAFLVFGPMVDIKSVLMFGTTFRRRTVALMVLLAFQMTLLAAVIINLYL